MLDSDHQTAASEVESKAGARAGHLGEERNVEITDIGASDRDDEGYYINLDMRSSATCTKDVSDAWMIVWQAN